jgi:hypothetical protein
LRELKAIGFVQEMTWRIIISNFKKSRPNEFTAFRCCRIISKSTYYFLLIR